MMRIAHRPDGVNVVERFSSFAARFILAVLAATVVALLALHTFASGSVATAPANDESAATSHVAPEPSEPIFYQGRPN